MLDRSKQMARGTVPQTVMQSKLCVPEAPTHLVSRHRLLSEFETVGARRIYITGPAGTGKSTLLAEWCRARDLEAVVAWVSLDERDRDATRLWSHVFESVERSVPGIGIEAGNALRAGASLTEVVLPLFCNDLELAETEVTIALDDVHTLECGQARDSIDEFAANLPSQAVLATSSRRGPNDREQRWIMHGEALHVSAEDLRFSISEADRLLEAMVGGPVPAQLVEKAVTSTRGWAVPLRLIAHELETNGKTLAHSDLKGEPLLEYLFTELLDTLTPEELDAFAFLATLGRFNRRLVAEVVPAGSSLLDSERREALGIHALAGGWFAVHDLVRETVEARDVLHARPSDLIAAARSYDERGHQDEAIVCAAAAGEWGLAAELLNRAWPSHIEAGQVGSFRTLLELVPREVMAGDARLVATAAWVAGFQHDLVERDLLLDQLEHCESSGAMPDGTESVRHSAALNRALIPSDCRMLTARADVALKLTPEGSRWMAYALMGVGNACMARGDLRGCQEAYLAASERSSALFQVATIGGAALAAALDMDLRQATRHAERAAKIRADSRLEHVSWLAMHEIASGYVSLRQGSVRDAVACFEAAEAGVHAMIEPYPHLCALLGLAEAHHALGELAAAADALDRAERRVAATDGVGDYFEAQLEEARRLYSAEVVSVESLSDRELTVLRMLATTQLSQGEIAVSLNLSRNTVKTHTRSIYRKLQVGSRGRASERARQLGLA